MTKSFKLSTQDELGRAVSYLNTLSLIKPLTLIIKLYKRNRTNAQNSLLWIWLKVIGDDLGYTEEEMHEVFKKKYLRNGKEIYFGGIRYEIPPSTAKLNTKEFTEYLNKIELFATGDLGIILPHPEDKYYEAMGLDKV